MLDRLAQETGIDRKQLKAFEKLGAKALRKAIEAQRKKRARDLAQHKQDQGHKDPKAGHDHSHGHKDSHSASSNHGSLPSSLPTVLPPPWHIFLEQRNIATFRESPEAWHFIWTLCAPSTEN